MIIAVYYIAAPSAPGYRAIAEASIVSARMANPDAKILHATDKRTDPITAAHGVMQMDIGADVEDVVKGKAAFTVWMGKYPTENWAIVDADVVHKKPMEPLLDGCDVALLVRGKPIMSINAGLIMGRPGFTDFWDYYNLGYNSLITEFGNDLPRICHPWWAEQVALSGMVGSLSRGDVDVMGANVRLHEMNDTLPMAQSMEEARAASGIGVHFKGAYSKQFVVEYAKEIWGEATANSGGSGGNDAADSTFH